MKLFLLLSVLAVSKLWANDVVVIKGITSEQFSGVDWFDYRDASQMRLSDPAKIARPNSAFIFASQGSGLSLAQLKQITKKKQLGLSSFSSRQVFSEESKNIYEHLKTEIVGAASCAGVSFVATAQGKVFIVNLFASTGLNITELSLPQLPHLSGKISKKISHLAVDCGQPNWQRDNIHPWLRRSMSVFVAYNLDGHGAKVYRFNIADVMHGIFEVTSVKVLHLPIPGRLIDIKSSQGSLFTLVSPNRLYQWDVAPIDLDRFKKTTEEVQFRQQWSLSSEMNWKGLTIGANSVFYLFYEKEHELYFVRARQDSLITN